jgi:DNA polymerase I
MNEENERWRYNCEDCVRTREVGEVELSIIEEMKLAGVHAFQQRLFWPVLSAMTKGVLIDKKARDSLALELQEEMAKREQHFLDVLGHGLNPRSPKQMMALFYDDLKFPVQLNRKTRTPSLDDDSLQKLAAREPLIRQLIKWISEYRSLGVFLSTFVGARLDYDGRMRSSFNICGTETYRFSSSTNAFDSGMNLQNIPKGSPATEPDELELPNVRKLFIPDPGFTFFDCDLDRADLQVVVWEADDSALKSMLKEGTDIHAENAKTLGISRQLSKSWVHGTNYGGGPRTMSVACGIPVHQAEKMRERWFQAHPGIRRWHERVELQLRTKKTVENRLGYRRFYFDRVEGLLPEALAWIPQSTVACVINRIWVNLWDNLKDVQVLLQVHDSLAGQFPSHLKEWCLKRIKEEAQVVVPYDDPLIIPIGIKTSEQSWGACA